MGMTGRRLLHSATTVSRWLSARTRQLQAFVIFCSVLFFLLEFAPYFSENASLTEDQKSLIEPQKEKLRQGLLETEQGGVQKRGYNFKANLFLEVDDEYTAYVSTTRDNKKSVTGSDNYKYIIRYDNVVISLIVVILTVASIGFVATTKTDASKPPKVSFSTDAPHQTVEELLLVKYRIAQQNREVVTRRATYMFVSGIMMAFLGVFLFYYMEPDYRGLGMRPFSPLRPEDHAPTTTSAVLQQAANDISTFLNATAPAKLPPKQQLGLGTPRENVSESNAPGAVEAIRSLKEMAIEQIRSEDKALERDASLQKDVAAREEAVQLSVFQGGGIGEFLSAHLKRIGTLIFVESIAWFLLRQYGLFVGEYREHHREGVRASNLLIAYNLNQKIKGSGKLESILASVLGEYNQEYLSEGESTEYLEALKNSEKNILEQIMGKIEDVKAIVTK